MCGTAAGSLSQKLSHERRNVLLVPKAVLTEFVVVVVEPRLTIAREQLLC
jgi:hypothetical protein